MSNVVKSIGKAIKGVVKGVVKVVTGVVKAVVDVVSSVVNFITQPFLGLLGGMPDMPSAEQESARQQGVLVTQQGSNVNIPVVYGYRQVGGTITFAETGADNNRYLWVAYALSEGPIEGLKELFIDDNQLPADIIPLLNNGQTVTINKGKYKDRVQLQFAHGIYNTTPSNSNIGTWSILQDAPSWKSTMAYNGVAVLFARYEWKKIETQEDADNNPFSGSIPAIKASILGRKVASLTIASPDSYTYVNAPTRFSFNPAEILLDYLRNPRYGKGLTNDDIDWDSWKTAAAKCNQNVEYVSGKTGSILTCHYVLDTAQTIFANTKTLLAGFRGYMPFSQGKYKLRIEDAGDPTDITSGVATIVATFTEDNIQGPITYSAIERTSKYNQVSVSYVDPDKKWSVQSVIYPETDAERQVYIAKDGGRVNKLDVAFPTITNYAIAKDMARLLFNKSRYQESVTFTASSQALELEVGDNINIQSKMLDFNTIPWRIVSMKINNDMTVDLGCVRNEDTIYPHTRYGEEDIILPPYIPKGATIDYPATVTIIGLNPPTNAVVPYVHQPPRIFSVSPTKTAGAGVNDITVNGANFQTGITAKWIGDDGTEYTPGAVTRNGITQITVETTASMTDANQPYDLRVENSATYGSLTARFNNCLTVDNVTEPVPEEPIQDPPVPETPEDPTITPDPSDPPDTGPDDVTNPPTPEPEPVVTYDDFVEFTRIDYTVEGDLVYANITGVQPDRNDYKELNIYYKRNIASDTVYQQMTVTTKPGANQPFTFRLGPLLKGRTPYVLISRVKYATGELSTVVNKIIINTSGAKTTEDPRDFVEQASTGWPSDPGEPNNATDNKIDKLEALTLTTGGVPRDPKELQITVRQDINNQAVNWNVNGIAYYYKSSSSTTWTRNEYTFSGNYVPGVEQTFTLDADIGSPVYPSVPTPAQQNYDFIFRLKYNDGKESSEQIRVMGARTEYSALGAYAFDPFYTVYNYKEKSTAYDINLGDPSAPSAKTSMTIGLDQITATLSGTKQINFYVKPPEASVLADWRGIRFRYRKVVPGTDPEFEEYTSTNVGVSGISGLSVYPIEIEFDSTYEWILTPLYADSGTRSESTESLFGVGFVHRKQAAEEYPSTGNWLQSFNFKDMKTDKALKTIDEAFPAPADPIIKVVAWKQIQPTKNKVASKNFYELTFDHRHLSGYSQLNVYRRIYNPGSMVGVPSGGLPGGVGAWEKVEVTETNGSGNVTVQFRQPLIYNYNYQFNPSVAASATNVLKSAYIKDTDVEMFPGNFDQFLLVVVDGSGEATKGLLLPQITGLPLSEAIDGLLTKRPEEVELSSFNAYDTDLDRNLNQARSYVQPTDTTMWYGRSSWYTQYSNQDYNLK
jgi:hypothetical protein